MDWITINTVIFVIVGWVLLELIYLLNVKKNMKDLKKAVKTLKFTKEQIERAIQDATLIAAEEKPTEQVQEWLKEVEEKERKADEIEGEYSVLVKWLGLFQMNFWLSYRISKQIAELAKVVTELISETANFDKLTESEKQIPSLQLTEPNSPSTDTSEPENFDKLTVKHVASVRLTMPNAPSTGAIELYVERAITYLRDGIDIVGIWGMGLVGKTTILKRIEQHHEIAALGIDYVKYIHASDDVTIEKLQRLIAESLGLQLPVGTREMQAHTLGYILKDKSFLILLDNLWQAIDFLKDLGIQYLYSNNNDNAPNKKLIFATRSEAVIEKMSCRERQSPVTFGKIKVECLDHKESWNLFLKYLGEAAKEAICSNERVYECADRLAKKCGGLPGALLATAEAMAAKRTLQDWEDAVHSVHKFGLQNLWDEKTDIFPCLKVSYDCLQSNTLRQCFLRCALWPEDRWIHKNEVIQCWLGLGLIDDNYFYIGQAYGKGHCIIKDLRRACLLEIHPSQSFVKQHILIRRMALWIAADCGVNWNKWLVQVEGDFIVAPEWANVWSSMELMSVMLTEEAVLPRGPNCPNLKALTLYCSGSFSLVGFFLNMPALTYLNLSGNSLSEFPLVICSLVQLRYLNLSDNKIESLPKQLASLSELRQLILSKMECLKKIPYGVISGLNKLEILDMSNTLYSEWCYKKEEMKYKELSSSQVGLKGLGITTSNRLPLIKLSKNPRIHLSRVNIYKLYEHEILSLSDTLLLGSNTRRSLQELKIVRAKCLEELMIGGGGVEDYQFENLEFLGLSGNIILKKITWEGEGSGVLFRNLRFLVIESCNMLKDASWIQQLRYLEVLRLQNCSGMENVIKQTHGITEEGGDTKILSHLRILVLDQLPSLTSFYMHKLIFCSLQYVKVSACPNLDFTIFSRFGCDGLRNGLEWQDSSIQSTDFLPYLETHIVE